MMIGTFNPLDPLDEFDFKNPPEPKPYIVPATGWLCPRCGKSNSPAMMQCDCTTSDLPITGPTCGPVTGPVDGFPKDMLGELHERLSKAPTTNPLI